jgi:hypothetical protein
MEYKTVDLNLGAALKVLGYKMTGIDVVGTRGTFIFANVDKEILNNYDLGKVLVEPISFNAAVKQLTTSCRRMSQK